jgi:hypothetical protein
VVDVLSTVELGARLHGETFQWGYQGPSALEEAVLLNKSIAAELPSTTIHGYGVEVGLRYRHVEIGAGFYTNAGITPKSSLQYDDGGEAVAIQPQTRSYVMRGQYLFSLNETVNLGGEVRYLKRTDHVNQTSEGQSFLLFEASTGSQHVLMLVPLFFDFGRVGIESHFGGTLWSSHTVTYDMDLVRFPNTLDEPVGGPEDYLQFRSGRLQTWTAYLGTRFQLKSMVLRVGGTGEVSTLPDVFSERRFGLQASIGLPF